MKIFGTKVFVLDKTQTNKLGSRGLECVFMGYATASKAYRLWCPEKGRILVSGDVKFLNSPGFTIKSNSNSEVKFNDSTKSEYQLRNSKVSFQNETEILETEWEEKTHFPSSSSSKST